MIERKPGLVDPTLTNLIPHVKSARGLSILLFLVVWVLAARPALAQPVHTSNSPLPAASLSVPYSFTFTATGGTPAYTWAITSGTVPNMTLNADTGVLSGTPLTSGVFQITVTVTDSMGQGTPKIFIVPINSGPLEITTFNMLPSGTVGAPYSTTLQAQGGAGPRTWSTAGGTVPPGLAFNSAGVLSGIPTLAGRFSFEARVQDAFSSQATKTMDVLMIGCPTGNAVAGIPYASAVQIGPVSQFNHFFISSGSLPNGLTLNENTGAVIGTPSQPGVFPITYEITDGFSESTWYASCSMTVAASFTLACPANSGNVGVPYSSAIVPAGGFPPYSNYGLALGSGPLPNGLTLNGSTGALTGTPTQQGTFPVTFTVRDSLNHTTTSNCSINIGPPTLSLACPADSGTVSLAYSSGLAAANGVPPYSNFQVQSGTLPPGLSLNAANGALTGNPTQSGAFPILFSVRDSTNTTATANCSINIAPPPPSLACPATTAQVNTPYQSALVPSGVSPFTGFAVSSGNLPPGLTLNAVTGSVFGNPTQHGTFQTGFSVRDANNVQANQNCTFTVAPAPLVLGCPSGFATANAFYASSVAGIGGVAPYTFSLSSGVLPTGLTFNPANGAIAGTPEAPGDFPLRFRVTDSTQTTAENACRITVDAPASSLRAVGSCSNIPFAMGSSIRIPLSATGGAGGYSFRVVSPSWMRLEDNQGIFTAVGTPPEPGTYTISAIVTDDEQRQASFNCSIRVLPPLSLTASCPTNPIPIGTPFSVPMSVQGGQPPYTWRMSGPEWLKLAAQYGSVNELFGTPPAPGSFSFTITVSDSINSLTASFTCTIRVPEANLMITATPGCPVNRLPSLQPFQQSYVASGGAQNFTWSLAGPPWLSLSQTQGASTSIAGTVPGTGGVYPFTLTLRDANGTATATFSCQLDTIPALSIRGAKPPFFTQGESFSLNLEGLGGQPPYRWSVSGPGFVSLSPSAGPVTVLSGTPPNTDPFSCSVTLSDDAGSVPATFDCSAPVRQPALRVDSPSGSCPANPIILTRPFTTTLTAVGGDGNYRWSLRGPSWLTASPLTGRSTTLSGTPTEPGSFDFEVSLTDGTGAAAEPFRCRVVVDLPAIPSISIVGLALGGDPLQEVTVGLQLSAPAPIRLEAEVELTFESAGFGATDNPQVQFVEPGATANGRRFRFIIEPGQTATSLVRIRPGTVTGTIRVRLVSVIAAGRDVTGPDRPSRQVVVPRLRPIITDFQFANETETGFTLVITGYSTPRDMISGLVTFNARQGTTLTGPTSFTVQLSEFFRSYYSGSGSQIGGSTFVLRIPVTVDGNKNDIAAVSVRLTNSVGDSDTATRNR